MEHKWCPCANGTLAPQPVVAGQDSDGDTIYVGRAEHAGDLLPAKVIPNKRKAYVSFGGKEVEVENYEVLSGLRYNWAPASNGEVPAEAVKVGKAANGEILYAGRGQYEGSLTVGKVHPSHGCLYIPYGEQEVKLSEYEVLTQPDEWIASTADSMPQDALQGGCDADGDAIFVGRVLKEGDLMPCKVIPNKGGAYVAFGGEEHKVEDFQVLTGAGFKWVHSLNGNIPSDAVPAGSTSEGEVLYVGRAKHENSLCIGKIHPSHGCLYLPYGGGEIKVQSYEVLVRS